LGLENIVKEVNPKLIKKETISKTTTWVKQDGTLLTKDYKDTYELYKVEGKDWSVGTDGSSWNTPQPVYYVKCKDTSTDREYMLWINAESVCRTNDISFNSSRDDFGSKITPIQAIAWTIQTNVPKGGIDKIVRQGDCIMIKKKKNVKLVNDERHLTEKEYRKLLEYES